MSHSSSGSSCTYGVTNLCRCQHIGWRRRSLHTLRSHASWLAWPSSSALPGPGLLLHGAAAAQVPGQRARFGDLSRHRRGSLRADRPTSHICEYSTAAPSRCSDPVSLAPPPCLGVVSIPLMFWNSLPLSTSFSFYCLVNHSHAFAILIMQYLFACTFLD